MRGAQDTEKAVSDYRGVKSMGEKQYSFSVGSDAYGAGVHFQIRGEIPNLNWGKWIELSVPKGAEHEKHAPCGCVLVRRTYKQPPPYGGGENLLLDPCDIHKGYEPK